MTTTLFPEEAKPVAPTITELKLRVGNVKQSGKLKGRGRHVEVALAARPELDTIKGGNHITNVWNLRITDLVLTQAWEKAAGIQEPSPALAS